MPASSSERARSVPLIHGLLGRFPDSPSQGRHGAPQVVVVQRPADDPLSVGACVCVQSVEAKTTFQGCELIGDHPFGDLGVADDRRTVKCSRVEMQFGVGASLGEALRVEDAFVTYWVVLVRGYTRLWETAEVVGAQRRHVAKR